MIYIPLIQVIVSLLFQSYKNFTARILNTNDGFSLMRNLYITPKQQNLEISCYLSQKRIKSFYQKSKTIVQASGHLGRKDEYLEIWKMAGPRFQMHCFKIGTKGETNTCSCYQQTFYVSRILH